MTPDTFFRVLDQRPWRVGLRPAVAPPDRRPLRREPQPRPEALPVPGHHEALAGRHPGRLRPEPHGPRHRSSTTTTCASTRTTGNRRRSAPGASAGRSCSTASRSRSSRTSSRPAASTFPRSPSRSPTAWSGWRCSSSRRTTSTTSTGRTTSRYRDLRLGEEKEFSEYNFIRPHRSVMLRAVLRPGREGSQLACRKAACSCRPTTCA